MTRCAHTHVSNTYTHTHVSNTYRLFGLTPIIQTDCDRPTELLVRSDVLWTEILSPIFILGLFWLLATDLRMWLSTPVSLSYSQLALFLSIALIIPPSPSPLPPPMELGPAPPSVEIGNKVAGCILNIG